MTTMTTLTATVTTERRASPRYKVLKRGTIAFGGGSIDCTVRNLSADGARLDIASTYQVPQSFTLVIEADDFLRRCRPVWATESRLGVKFE